MMSSWNPDLGNAPEQLFAAYRGTDLYPISETQPRPGSQGRRRASSGRALSRVLCLSLRHSRVLCLSLRHSGRALSRVLCLSLRHSGSQWESALSVSVFAPGRPTLRQGTLREDGGGLAESVRPRVRPGLSESGRGEPVRVRPRGMSESDPGLGACPSQSEEGLSESDPEARRCLPGRGAVAARMRRASERGSGRGHGDDESERGPGGERQKGAKKES